MKGLTLLFIAILLLASSALADSNRVLLRPPENYNGVNIGGTQFVHGQVYLPQAADTALLMKFGFRDFTWAGSSSRYKKFKAWWPIETEIELLPDEVIGLTYDKLTREDLAYAAIMQPQDIPAELRDNLTSLRFALRPSDGKPDLIYRKQPYVEGTIYCSKTPDEDELEKLGIELLDRFTPDEAVTVGIREDYIQSDAMWPLDLQAHELPSYVVGMVAKKAEPDYRRCFTDRMTYVNNYYCSPRQPSVQVYNYGGIQDPDGNYRSWRHDYNPNAYYYRTTSRTTLEPTTIGSYPGNKFLYRKGYYRRDYGYPRWR